MAPKWTLPPTSPALVPTAAALAGLIALAGCGEKDGDTARTTVGTDADTSAPPGTMPPTDTAETPPGTQVTTETGGSGTTTGGSGTTGTTTETGGSGYIGTPASSP